MEIHTPFVSKGINAKQKEFWEANVRKILPHLSPKDQKLFYINASCSPWSYLYSREYGSPSSILMYSFSWVDSHVPGCKSPDLYWRDLHIKLSKK